MSEAILKFGLQFGQQNPNFFICVESTKLGLLLNPEDQKIYRILTKKRY